MIVCECGCGPEKGSRSMDEGSADRRSITIERGGVTVATFDLTFDGVAPRLVLASCDPNLDEDARRCLERESLMAALLAYREKLAYSGRAIVDVEGNRDTSDHTVAPIRTIDVE